MAELDTLAEQLLLLRDKIDFDGWIVIPPKGIEGSLRVQVEWYLAGYKEYNFEMNITPEQTLGSISLMDVFVEKANRAIAEHYKNISSS